MKTCLKSAPEPLSLARFRSQFPDADWDAFKDDNGGDSYRELSDQLLRDQKGLCGFCEIEPSPNNRQVAHFHPKSDRNPLNNWALDWQNLWLCCKGGYLSWLNSDEEYLEPLPQNLSCDQVKADRVLDGLILNPGEVPAFPRVFKFEQWTDEIHIAADEQVCHSCGLDPALVSNTIRELNLNCRRLTRARLVVRKALENEVGVLRKAGVTSLSSTHLAPKWLGVQSTGYYRSFFTMLRWRLHDAGAETFLRNNGYQG